MSNDLETMIQTTLKQRAADAPAADSDGLVATTERRAGLTRRRRRAGMAATAVVAAAALIAAFAIPDLRDQPAEPVTVNITPPNVNADATGLMLLQAGTSGGPQLPTLTVYQDFQCPKCRDYFVGRNAIIARLVDQGLMNIELRTVTFLDENLRNDSSSRSAQAAACAAVELYYGRYVTTLYANQPENEVDGFTDDQLRVTFAAKAGITGPALKRFQSCYDSKQMAPFVSSVAKNAVDVDQISSVPSFAVNGKSPMWKGKDGTQMPWWETLGDSVDEWVNAINQIAAGASTPASPATAGYGVAKALPQGRPVALRPRAEVLKSGQTRIVLPGGTSENGVLLPQQQGLAVVAGMEAHPKATAGGGAVVVLAQAPAGGGGGGQIFADLFLVTSAGARQWDLPVASEVMVDPTGKTGMVLAADRAKNPTKLVPTTINLSTGAVLETWPAVELQTQLLGWTGAGIWVRNPQGAVSVVPRQGKAITPSAQVIKLDRVVESGKTRVKALVLGERGLCQMSWDDGAQVPDLKSAKADFCIPTKKQSVEVRAFQPQPDGSVLVVFDEEPFGPDNRRSVLVSPSGAVSDLPLPPALAGELVAVVGSQAGLLGAAEPNGCTLWRVMSDQTSDSVTVRWCVDGTVQRVPLSDDTEYLA